MFPFFLGRSIRCTPAGAAWGSHSEKLELSSRPAQFLCACSPMDLISMRKSIHVHDKDVNMLAYLFKYLLLFAQDRGCAPSRMRNHLPVKKAAMATHQ